MTDAGPDCFDRPQRLTPEAFAAWRAMREAAAADGVVLLMVSAFRSLDYQHALIAGKLAKGQELAAVLRVNAPPGFSEHHTGRAVDIGTPDCPALQQEFDRSPAFRWLEARAGDFGFHMSYPPDNPFGIIYEPWHWLFTESAADAIQQETDDDER